MRHFKLKYSINISQDKVVSGKPVHSVVFSETIFLFKKLFKFEGYYSAGERIGQFRRIMCSSFDEERSSTSDW